IRDKLVTEVQTCALPISHRLRSTIPCSTLQLAQRGAVDAHRVAVMPQAAQQRLHHGPVAQKVGPLVIPEIGCNNAGMPPVALLRSEERRVGKECRSGWWQ